MRTIPSLRWAAVLGGLALPTLGCGGGPEPGPAETASVDSVAADDLPVVQHYERIVAFVTPAGDSTLSVHWSWDSRVRPGEVGREIEGFLARNGTWERFVGLEWATPPTRAPWRILPQRPVRLLMGDGEALERIIYHEGGRELELAFGSTLSEWTGSAGETVRIQEGEVLLADRLVDGLLLDLSRSRGTGEPLAGDWVILSSPDNLQFVLEDPRTDDTSGMFRGWARLDFRQLQWPEVVVTWTEQRPFETARRDIPVAWSLASLDGEVTGELRAAASHLEVGEGEGPILPVRALFEVEGVLRMDGREFPVWGLWRHLQP
jgi:hypothetical protein